MPCTYAKIRLRKCTVKNEFCNYKSYIKEIYTAISHKISETNSSVKWRTTGKILSVFFLVLSRLATREATRIYHVYK